LRVEKELVEMDKIIYMEPKPLSFQKQKKRRRRRSSYGKL